MYKKSSKKSLKKVYEIILNIQIQEVWWAIFKWPNNMVDTRFYEWKWINTSSGVPPINKRRLEIN
jgi:hypothetical protein